MMGIYGVPAARSERQLGRSAEDRSSALNSYTRDYARYAVASAYQYVEVNVAADWSLCVHRPSRNPTLKSAAG